MSQTSSKSTSTLSSQETTIKRREIELKNHYLTETMAYFEFDEFVEEELARWIKYKTEPTPQNQISVIGLLKASYKAVKEKLGKLLT